VRPSESRNSREPLPSQIFTPWEERVCEEVSPVMNQRSSAMTALVKTRFVVRRGRSGVPARLRANLSGRGAKME
jgi:hypothetical protein